MRISSGPTTASSVSESHNAGGMKSSARATPRSAAASRSSPTAAAATAPSTAASGACTMHSSIRGHNPRMYDPKNDYTDFTSGRALRHGLYPRRSPPMKRGDGPRNGAARGHRRPKGVTDDRAGHAWRDRGARRRGSSAPVYASIRGITSLVGGALEAASPATPVLGELAEDQSESCSWPRSMACSAIISPRPEIHRDRGAPATRRTGSATGRSWSPYTAPSMNARSGRAPVPTGSRAFISTTTRDSRLGRMGAGSAGCWRSSSPTGPCRWRRSPSSRTAWAGSSRERVPLRRRGRFWRSKSARSCSSELRITAPRFERVGNWLETLLGVTRYSAPDRGPRPLAGARGHRSSFWQRRRRGLARSRPLRARERCPDSRPAPRVALLRGRRRP